MPVTFQVMTALNLRAGPGVANPVLRVLPEGARLTEVGAGRAVADGDTWVNVEDEAGTQGWVHSAFVTADEAAQARQFRVTADALNLRGAPGTGAAILRVLPQGEVVTEADAPPVTLDDGNRWLNVSSKDGVTGWLDDRFVAKVSGGGGEAGGALAWGAHVSDAFRGRVREIAARLGFEPDILMAAIAFESARTFSPSVRNPLSGATGLIQFMPATAEGLGTSAAALAQMTAVEQLDFVERYLSPFGGRIRTVADLYMSILFPVAVGKPDDFALFRKGTVAYGQNAGLDLDGDGVVTKREASQRVVELLQEGRLPENLG